jgi:hypothetical protein
LILFAIDAWRAKHRPVPTLAETLERVFGFTGSGDDD